MERHGHDDAHDPHAAPAPGWLGRLVEVAALPPLTWWVKRSILVGVVACLGALMGLLIAVLPVNMLYVPILLIVLTAGLTLWAMPEWPSVPLLMMRRAFMVFIPVVACIPAYVAIDPPALPWISAVRLSLFAMMMLFLFVISGSAAARSEIVACIRGSGGVGYIFLSVAITFFLSIFLAYSPGTSAKAYADAVIYWFLPFLSALLVLRTSRDIRTVFILISWSSIFLLIIGIIEFRIQQRVFLRYVPSFLIASDPAMLAGLMRADFRNGIYRVSSSFIVALSYAEYLGMIMPIFYYMGIYWKGFKNHLLTGTAALATLGGIILTGSRGGMLSLVAGTGAFFFFYAVRATITRRTSLVGPFLLSLYVVGGAAFVGLAFTWKRLNVMLFGGNESAASTEARLMQWEMALPHFWRNPVTGHGLGNGLAVVGFMSPSGALTLDSYFVSLMVEVGSLGLVSFFLFVIGSALIAIRGYFIYDEEEAAPLLAIASGLIGFAIYRLALSQSENHTMMFIMTGIIACILYRLGTERKARQKALREA